jgi:hypothetical protein
MKRFEAYIALHTSAPHMSPSPSVVSDARLKLAVGNWNILCRNCCHMYMATLRMCFHKHVHADSHMQVCTCNATYKQHWQRYMQTNKPK